MKCSLTLHLILSKCGLPCVLIVVSCLPFAGSVGEALDGEADQFILTEKYPLLFFWPFTDSQFAAPEGVGMGSNKTGRRIWEWKWDLGQQPAVQRNWCETRMFVWVNLAKSNSKWSIQVPETYSNFYWLGRVKELSQLEQCQWKHCECWHSRCVLSLCV